MNIKEIKQAIKYIYHPKRSVLLRGKHGLGKSQVMFQIAQELSVETATNFGFIDIRLAQREVGDLIGMPRGMDKFSILRTVFNKGELIKQEEIVSNVTIHDVPHWFPQDAASKGIVFFDELNRATREVQQAVFELILDRRMNFHYLPDGWRVCSAVNDDQDTYQIVEMDPALLDRFAVIEFAPTVPEWLEHADKIHVHDAIMKYISKFGSSLDTPSTIEPNKVYQSRRSWVALSDDILNAAENKIDLLKDLDMLFHIGRTHLGTTEATAFKDFVQKDYRVLTADDILNHFPKHADDFKNMETTEVVFYNKQIVEYIKKENIKLTKKQGENLKKYYMAVPKEAASGFWSDFIGQCREEAGKWYKSDPEIGEYTQKYLNKSQATK
jgi:hypothetical protein